jgi:hypothetical protein
MKHHAAPHHDLMDSATYRQQYRLAWEQWLATLKFDRFVTLNFNRDTTPAGARRMLGLFLARLDRRFLGRRWCEKGWKRTFGVAVLENQETTYMFNYGPQVPPPAEPINSPRLQPGCR